MTLRLAFSRDEIFAGFELSVLHKLDFKSIAIPVNGDPFVAAFLKRRGFSVWTNDLTQADWHRAIAHVQNESESLEAADAELILLDAYEPPPKLANPGLERFFGPVDAIWFDNVRCKLNSFESNLKFALAVDLVFRVGNYIRSFQPENIGLRRPASKIFRELHAKQRPPISGQITARASHMTPREFIASAGGNLLLLRVNRLLSAANNGPDWREIWLRAENASANNVVSERFLSRSAFLTFLADLLDRASHFNTWALSFIETGILCTEDLLDVVGQFRKVSAVYTKDFSELTGLKAKILVA